MTAIWRSNQSSTTPSRPSLPIYISPSPLPRNCRFHSTQPLLFPRPRAAGAPQISVRSQELRPLSNGGQGLRRVSINASPLISWNYSVISVVSDVRSLELLPFAGRKRRPDFRFLIVYLRLKTCPGRHGLVLIVRVSDYDRIAKKFS